MYKSNHTAFATDNELENGVELGETSVSLFHNGLVGLLAKLSSKVAQVVVGVLEYKRESVSIAQLHCRIQTLIASSRGDRKMLIYKQVKSNLHVHVHVV